MKAQFKNDKTGFEPKTIELTFESQKELDAFGALFNYTPFTDAFEKISGTDSETIRLAAEEAGAECSGEPHKQVMLFVQKHPALKR